MEMISDIIELFLLSLDDNYCIAAHDPPTSSGDTDMADETADMILTFTARMVSDHVSHSAVAADQLPSLIRAVHHALAKLGKVPEVDLIPEPAVSAKQSMTATRMTCMDCGKTFISLKRHLKHSHDLSPDRYRRNWKLPADYPMVAPNYTKRRSALAKESGLGRRTEVGAQQPGTATMRR